MYNEEWEGFVWNPINRRGIFLNNALESFIADIKDEKERGMQAIDLDVLVQHLESILKIDNKANDRQFEIEIEQYKAQEVIILEVIKKNFESVVMMGQSAMKSALLFNGGACIAFIAFFNNNIARLINGDTNIVLYERILQALDYFGAGALVATVAYGITYITQERVAKEYTDSIPEMRTAFWEKRQIKNDCKLKTSRLVQVLAVSCIIYSYICAWEGIAACESGFSFLLNGLKY